MTSKRLSRDFMSSKLKDDRIFMLPRAALRRGRFLKEEALKIKADSVNNLSCLRVDVTAILSIISLLLPFLLENQDYYF